MKRVAILTFQAANNYGAMLQCYALQKKIDSLDAECKVINYKCDYLSKPYGIRALRRKGCIRYFLGMVNACLRIPRSKKFESFRREIPMTKSVDKKSIESLNDEFDIFITGSDQVWNYELTDFDKTYFLDFVRDDEKKCSYAASFGFDKISDLIIKNKYISLLESFKYISVREQSAKEIVFNLLAEECKIVVDPTLLLDKKDWEKISILPKTTEKYIFVYQLAPSKNLSKILHDLVEATGYKVIYVPFSLGNKSMGKWCLNVGPREWIGYIRNAEYVVTDSFHGTVFSIIFHKKAYSCINELATRIVSILELLELKEMLFDDKRSFELIEKIDFSKADEMLAKLKIENTSYINKMLL